MLSVANKIPLAQVGRRKWIEAPGVSFAADQCGRYCSAQNEKLRLHYSSRWSRPKAILTRDRYSHGSLCR
jgi:hypothetical protein